MIRNLILTIGPIALTAGSFLICQASGLRPFSSLWGGSLDRVQNPLERTHSENSPSMTSLARTLAQEPPQDPALPIVSPKRESLDLQAACEQLAERHIAKMDSRFSTYCRAPFVLVGDLSVDQLVRLDKSVVRPVERAVTEQWIAVAPRMPITVTVLRDSDSYRRFTSGRRRSWYQNYYGYYLKSRREAVVNLASGPGTLAHEIVHALLDDDFPGIAEWFDEGLASLVEESRIVDQGTRIIGEWNWRCEVLREVAVRRQLEPPSQLLLRGSIRRGYENIDYATARCFCLYLQQRGLLDSFYRVWRERRQTDVTGIPSLRSVLAVESLDEFDRGFEQWLLFEHAAPQSSEE